MKKSGGKLIATILTLAVLISGSVFAIDPGGIGGRPANPDPNNPRSETIFIYDMKPLEVKKDQLYLNNSSDQSATVELFAVDGITANDGAFTCKQNIEKREGAGAWVELSKKEVEIGAKSKTLVDFTVKVPEGAEPGEHNACIAIQVKGQSQDAGGGVQLTTRQAVRMAITLPGDIKRQVLINSFTVEVDHVDKEENGRTWQQVFNVKLKNDGNVSADTEVSVKLRDIFGNVIYENKGQYPVIAGKTLEQRFINEDRPMFGGIYKATADVAYDKRAGTFGLGDEANLERLSADPVTVFLWPTVFGWMVIAGVVLLVVAIVAWRITGRKHRKRRSVGF